MKMTKTLAAIVLMAGMASCGGSKEAKENKAVDDEAFYATQPVTSGQYRAVYYCVGDSAPRKGPFDGRVYVALSPEQSGIYVYENGNRAKIDYVVALQAPFEKGDSGIYRTTDVHGVPVTMRKDSADYKLAFTRKAGRVEITVEPEPLSTGSALDIMERMAKQKGN